MKCLALAACVVSTVAILVVAPTAAATAAGGGLLVGWQSAAHPSGPSTTTASSTTGSSTAGSSTTGLSAVGSSGSGSSVGGVSVVAPARVVPYTSYNGVCGSGYSVIDSAVLSTLGTVYLTYDSSSGYNCVVTVRANPGTAMEMSAAIRLTGNSTWIIDEGNYTTYAGPVYLHAPGQCIDWAGSIAGTSVQRLDTHCG